MVVKSQRGALGFMDYLRRDEALRIEYLKPIERVGIVILDAPRGLWRFADDSLDSVRENV